jgi:hypothetical protein
MIDNSLYREKKATGFEEESRAQYRPESTPYDKRQPGFNTSLFSLSHQFYG